jgi:hypothetical protein
LRPLRVLEAEPEEGADEIGRLLDDPVSKARTLREFIETCVRLGIRDLSEYKERRGGERRPSPGRDCADAARAASSRGP